MSIGLQDVLGMNQWREADPKATLREIEAGVDAQMNQLRAQLIQELLLTRLRRSAIPPPSRPARYSWRQPFLRCPPSLLDPLAKK